MSDYCEDLTLGPEKIWTCRACGYAFRGFGEPSVDGCPDCDSQDLRENPLGTTAITLLAALKRVLPYAAQGIQGTTEGDPILASARAAITMAETGE